MNLKKTIILTLALGTSLVATPAFAAETTDTIKDTQKSITEIQAVIEKDKKHNEELSNYIKEQLLEVEKESQQAKNAQEDLSHALADTEAVQAELTAADNILHVTNINSAAYVFAAEKVHSLKVDLKVEEAQQAKEQAAVDKEITKEQKVTAEYQELLDQQTALVADQKASEKQLATKKAQLNKLVEKKKQAEKAAKEKAAKAKAAKEKAKQTQGVDHSNSGNAYEWGQCTWYVKTVAPWVGTYWGNGCQWGASAAADGYQVDSTPEVGSVVVFAAGQNGANAQYGHVGYVEAVNGDGTFTFSQGGLGFANPAGPNYQTLSAAGMQFIHKN